MLRRQRRQWQPWLGRVEVACLGGGHHGSGGDGGGHRRQRRKLPTAAVTSFGGSRWRFHGDFCGCPWWGSRRCCPWWLWMLWWWNNDAMGLHWGAGRRMEAHVGALEVHGGPSHGGFAARGGARGGCLRWRGADWEACGQGMGWRLEMVKVWGRRVVREACKVWLGFSIGSEFGLGAYGVQRRCRLDWQWVSWR